MTNITLLGVELILCLLLQIIIYKAHKIEGIYAYTIILFILSCITSLKVITIYNFELNLGFIPFITGILSTNIIVQKKGYNAIKNLVIVLIISLVASYAVLYLTSLLTSSQTMLFTNKSYDNIMLGSERLYFANITTILYTILLNSKLYYYLKRIKNKIWISNLFSGIIIQFIASILFIILAYTFIKEPIDMIKMIIIRYMISLIILIIGTIPLYITNILNKQVADNN